MRSILLPWTTVFAPNDAGPHLSSSAYFIPATGRMRCADIIEMRAALEIIPSTSNTLNIQVGYQVANTEALGVSFPTPEGTIEGSDGGVA